MRKSVVRMGFFCGAVGLLTAGTWAQVPQVKLWVTEVYEVNPDGTFTPKCLGNCPSQDLLPGIAQPGDLINIEVQVAGWDGAPDSGFCSPVFLPPGSIACTVSNQASCPLSHCRPGGSTPCVDNDSCISGSTCTPDTCEKSPLLAAYQWTLNSSTLSNGGPSPGLIPAQLACTTDADCACAYTSVPPPPGDPDFNDCSDFAGFGFCTCAALNVCDGGVCGLASAAYIDSSAVSNYVFFNMGAIPGISMFTPDFQIGAFLGSGGVPEFLSRCSSGGAICNVDADCSIGTCEPRAQSPYYLGTLLLEATNNACGMFTIDLDRDPAFTFFRDGLAFPLPSPFIDTLTIDFGDLVTCNDNDACTLNDRLCGGVCAGTPIVCDPGQECIDGACQSPCSYDDLIAVYWADDSPLADDTFDRPGGTCPIDALIPTNRDVLTDKNGWNRLIQVFNCDPTEFASRLLPGDFTSQTFPPSQGATSVNGISSDAIEKTVTLQLLKRIRPLFWTRITHLDSGLEWNAGYLPTDSNEDQVSNANDINALIDSISNVLGSELPLYVSDMNRSGIANGQDIPWWIDLANGTSAFDVWFGEQLDPNPSCP